MLGWAFSEAAALELPMLLKVPNKLIGLPSLTLVLLSFGLWVICPESIAVCSCLPGKSLIEDNCFRSVITCWWNWVFKQGFLSERSWTSCSITLDRKWSSSLLWVNWSRWMSWRPPIFACHNKTFTFPFHFQNFPLANLKEGKCFLRPPPGLCSHNRHPLRTSWGTEYRTRLYAWLGGT